MADYVQRRKVWLMPTTRLPCTNAAETRNALKFAWVPQTRKQISAASKPKFAILYDHVGEILLFNNFFPIVDRCLSCEDIARETCAMVHRWTQSEFCTWQNSVRGKKSRKCIYSVPGQETAKHSAKFGWLPLSDVAAVTLPRSETRWNYLGCPKLTKRSQPLVGRSSPYCGDM